MAQLQHYYVTVIGGGLAGLSIAIQLANNNYKVALFEKEQYPFHKVCGEYQCALYADYLSPVVSVIERSEGTVRFQIQEGSG